MSAFRSSAITIGAAASVSLVQWAFSLSAQESSPAQSSTAPPSQPALQTPAPPPHAISRSPMRFAAPRIFCAGGARIVILVESKAARLTLNGHIYNMKQVVPADRSHRRFNKWHGNLRERSRSACGCRFDCPAQRSQPRRRRSCGCSRGRKNRHRRRKAPISFALKFDPSKATAEIPFAVSASITGHGKLLFVQAKAVTIPDIASPAPVHLALSRATSKKGQTPASAVPEAPPHL
jgi:hypothetical protein